MEIIFIGKLFCENYFIAKIPLEMFDGLFCNYLFGLYAYLNCLKSFSYTILKSYFNVVHKQTEKC